MTQNRFTRALALIGAMLALLPAAARAADPPPAAARAASAASAPAAGSAAGAGADAQVVVVAANRRAELAQKVSGVAQSESADQLRRDGITELRDLQVAVPGLNIANQEGNTEIYIRGVGSANNTELGDPGAAPHLNGVYIPRPRGLGLMFYDLERVEVNKGPQGTLYGRNAMAGTLNIITAKPKLGTFSGAVQGEFSARGGQGTEVALNLPLGETLAVRLATMWQSKDAGFHNVSPDPDAAKLKPAGLEENIAGRLSLLWTPTDRLTVSVVTDNGEEAGTGYPGANIFSAVRATQLRPEDLDLRRVVYRGAQGDMRNEIGGTQAQVAYDFDHMAAELSASRRTVDFHQRNAESDGIDWPGRDYGSEQWDNYSNVFWQSRSQSRIGEFRLYSTDDAAPVRWTTGAFTFDEDQQVGFLSIADRGYCCYSGTEFTMPKVNGRSSALYADGTWSITKSVRALGGLRYSKESKSRWGLGGNLALVLGGADFACCMATRLGTEGFVPNLLDRPNFDMSQVVTPQQKAQFLLETAQRFGARDTLASQIGPIADGSNPNGHCQVRSDIDNGFVTCPDGFDGGFSYANLTVPTQQVGHSKFNYTDWRLGGEWDVARDAMVYAKVSTGHKAGGFNDSFNGSQVPETFKPEELVVYELGSRNAFDVFGRRAVFNLTGFLYDYRDQVFQDLTCIQFDATQGTCSGYSLVNRNVASSRLAGLEGELHYGLPWGFNVDVNGAYLHTKIRSGVVADSRGIDYGQGGKAPLIDLAGNQLPLASKYNLALRLQQVIPLGAGKADWQALVSFRSGYFLSQYNEADVVFLDGTRQSALQAGFPDRQQGFTTINLGAGYTFDRGLRLEAFATNVTDVQASQKAIVGAGVDVRFLNDARSFGARMRMDF